MRRLLFPVYAVKSFVGTSLFFQVYDQKYHNCSVLCFGGVFLFLFELTVNRQYSKQIWGQMYRVFVHLRTPLY